MKSIIKLAVILLWSTLALGSNGPIYFYFANYTSVFILHSASPSAEFHPVLGGKDNIYIRYQNWASFNLTSLQEVDSTGAIIAEVDPLSLEWDAQCAQSTDATGNDHNICVLSSTAGNGASIYVTAESWSLGVNKSYGTITNYVQPDSLEISFNITNWPFQSPSNQFWLTLLDGIDGTTLTPSIDRSNPNQYEGTLHGDTIDFSIWLMTHGILDGVYTKFNYGLPQISGTQYAFILKCGAFNSSFYYDPNFSVLLKSTPDCSQIGGCGSHGACVDYSTCQCEAYYTGQTCDTKTNVSDPDGAYKPSKSNNQISVKVVGGVTAGVVVAVVIAVLAAMKYNIYRKRKAAPNVNVKQALAAHRASEGARNSLAAQESGSRASLGSSNSSTNSGTSQPFL